MCNIVIIICIRGKKRGFFFLKYLNFDMEKVWVVYGNLYFVFIILNEYICRFLILD